MNDFDKMRELRNETINRWKKAGLLDGLRDTPLKDREGMSANEKKEILDFCNEINKTKNNDNNTKMEN